MNAQNSIETETNRQSKGIIGGAILVTLGVLFLIGQVLQVEWYGYFLLAALSVLFLISGLLTRTPGLLIPGGILAGLSLGTWAVQLPALTMQTSEGGVFLLCFASGWALISLLAVLIGKPMWWPLIPGSILGLIGTALIAGGVAMTALQLLGTIGWPLILIAIGAYIIIRRTTK